MGPKSLPEKPQNVISERISDDIPPQINFLNIVIPTIVSPQIIALYAAKIRTPSYDIWRS